MNKTIRIYLVIFVAVIALMAIFNLSKKPVINWHETYNLDGKEPFGFYIFNQEMTHLFPNLERTSQSPYLYFQKKKHEQKTNIFIVDVPNLQITDEAWKSIEQQVKNGSTLCVVAGDFPKFMGKFVVYSSEFLSVEDSIKFGFTDKNRKATWIPDKYPTFQTSEFEMMKDTDGIHVLGYFQPQFDQKYANFMQIKYGKGTILWHLQPLCLTNYYLLKNDSRKYAETIFSYLPNQKTIWFLPSKIENSSSPLRFIIAHQTLRNAWYILFFGLILFVVFYAKRRQRIVPIIPPVKNSSVEFVRSISNLYLNEGTPLGMMQKKVTHFLQQIRSNYLLDTRRLNEDLAKKLQQKTNADEATIEKALMYIRRIQREDNTLTTNDLIEVNQLLDEILNH